MKVLGISFGTKNGRNDCMCKEALMGAQEAGAEIEFIHAFDLDIHHCTGCNGCVQGQILGMGVRCAQQDEFEWMLDKMLDADAIFFSTPIFEEGACGLFHTMMDRFGPRTDRGNVLDSKKMAEEKGTKMPDLRYLKEKAVSYISMGGSQWNRRVDADCRIHAMSPMWKIVDAKTFPWDAVIVMDEERRQTIHQMGYDLAMAAKDLDHVEYKGDEGLCPMCHARNFMFDADGKVVCEVCGIEGSMKCEDGKYSFEFPEEQREFSHVTLSGKAHHMADINSNLANAMRTMQSPEYKERIKMYKEFIQPMLPARESK